MARLRRPLELLLASLCACTNVVPEFEGTWERKST